MPATSDWCLLSEDAGVIRHIRKHDALSKGHISFTRKASTLYRREWETQKELPSLSVILHNLCINNDREDLLDDADLDIVDDELSVDHRQEQGDKQQKLLLIELQLSRFWYRQNKAVKRAFFWQVVTCVGMPNWYEMCLFKDDVQNYIVYYTK